MEGGAAGCVFKLGSKGEGLRGCAAPKTNICYKYRYYRAEKNGVGLYLLVWVCTFFSSVLTAEFFSCF